MTLSYPASPQAKSFVVSGGQLRNITRTTPDPVLPSNMHIAPWYFPTYAEIWKTQSAVRTVVGFLARNLAQLGIHLFERVSDDSRIRLRDHPMARLIDRPLPPVYKVSRYKLIADLMHDLGIYDMGLWIKVRAEDNPDNLGLIRVPPTRVRPVGGNWAKPDKFEIQGDGSSKLELDPDQVVFFRGYNPEDLRVGTSPIEALRVTLQEDWEANQHRTRMWREGARLSGYVTRPIEAPRWPKGGRERFRQQFVDTASSWMHGYSGPPMLEDGMTWVPAGVTPEQAEYVNARKLTREEVAAVYYIPPSQVGLLDDVNFSSMREMRTMTYTEALGPIIESLQQDLELQLLTEWEPDAPGGKIYVEFNIADKLKGSFEEQASAMSTLIGRPVMTANEGRARLNLPMLDEGEGLVVPLNVLIGGQPNPQNPLEEPNAPEPNPALNPPTEPEEEIAAQASQGVIRTKALVPESDTDKLEAVLAKFFTRQEAAVLSRSGGKANTPWNEARWNDELASDLFGPYTTLGTSAGRATLAAIGADPDEYDEERTLGWIGEHVAAAAALINEATAAQVKAALSGDDTLNRLKEIFKIAKTTRAEQISQTATTDMAGFGSIEAMQQTGRKGKKTWVVRSPRPRKSHKQMNGETVPVEKRFSNGARWPGDVSLDVNERARCSCELEIKPEKE